MKILCVFENRVRRDTTGVYYTWGFQRLGHEVKHMWPEQALELDDMEWDLAFKCDDGLRQHSNWNEKLHPVVYQCIDTHYHDAAEWRPYIAKQMDWTFTAQKDGVDFMREHGVDNCSWLPLAADEDLHSPDEGFDKHDKYDWAFVGNVMHSQPGQPNKRLEYLDCLLKEFPNGIISDYSYFKEMANIYGQSRVVVNFHINNDINMRFFEGMCSGACLLQEAILMKSGNGMFDQGLPIRYSYFYGKLLETFKELMDNPEAVSNYGKEGREEILGGHTYQHRCKEIIRKVESL